jgi:choline transporter-like protein 2/4/5
MTFVFQQVLYPTDSMGRICGQGELENRPFLLFFDLTRCLNPAVLSLGCPTPQVCVEECPKNASSGYVMQSQGKEVLAKTTMKPYCTPISNSEFSSKSAKKLIDEGLCPAWVLPSRPIIGRCLPMVVEGATGNEESSNSTIIKPEETANNEGISQDKLKKATTALGAFLSVRNIGERVFNDLSETWWMIGIGFILACFLSFLWIIMMRFMAGLMIWSSICLIFILVVGLFGYSIHRYLLVKDVADAQSSIFQVNLTPDYLKDVLSLQDTWLAFVCLLGAMTCIIFLVLLALRKRIQIAIQLIEQGAKAVGQMCSTIFFPLLPFTMHCGVVLWFAVIAMYLSSAGSKVYTINYNLENIGSISARDSALDGVQPPPAHCTRNDNCHNPVTKASYALKDVCIPGVFNDTCLNCPEIHCQFTRYDKEGGGWFGSWMNWFNLFGFFWAMEFVTALGELILAGVFAKWYWTRDKSQVATCTLGASFCNALIFHLGTVAFGSIIIAIIRFIRAILQYIESKLKAYNNDLTKCLFCVCKCCLWCLEKFMRFINRNAYIMCAIKSTNFCVSAKDAFNLLMRNMVRVVVLNNVVSFLLLLGKLVIVVGVGMLSYFVFSGQLTDDVPTLNYLFTPITVIVIGTYFITSSFFSVYAMAVDTLFLCFLEDLERNNGTSRPYFMSVGLLKVVGKMQKFNDDQLLVPLGKEKS